MSFATKIISMRKGPFNNALAFFDVGVGEVHDGEFVGVFQVKGFVLKAKKDGGYFYQPPAKLRLKDGKAVQNEKGFDQWDPHFDLFCETIGGKYQPTPAAWDARKVLLEQAVAAYESAEEDNRGRGAAKAPSKAAAKSKATVAAIKGDEPDAFPEALDEEDDDLPF